MSLAELADLGWSEVEGMYDPWGPLAIFDLEDGNGVFGSAGGWNSGAVEFFGGRWWFCSLHG